MKTLKTLWFPKKAGILCLVTGKQDETTPLPMIGWWCRDSNFLRGGGSNQPINQHQKSRLVSLWTTMVNQDSN